LIVTFQQIYSLCLSKSGKEKRKEKRS